MDKLTIRKASGSVRYPLMTFVCLVANVSGGAEESEVSYCVWQLGPLYLIAL